MCGAQPRCSGREPLGQCSRVSTEWVFLLVCCDECDVGLSVVIGVVCTECVMMGVLCA